MPIKRSFSLSSILMVLLFIILAVIAMFPLYAIVLASFKPAKELLRSGLNVKLQWDVMSFKNYGLLFNGGADNYLTWYKNSLLITILYTFLSLFFSSLVGYGLAMYNFKGRNIVFTLVLVTLTIPVEIIMLPLYKLIVNLNMIDTYAGVIIPFMAAPLPIFFFRQYALGMEKEFMDAGRIDGSTELGIFFRIMLPLMTPALSAMAILQALASWNSFLWPLIVMRTNEHLTLPIGLASLITPYGNNYTILIMGSVCAIIPILILFIIFQRYFISGLTVGGVKG